LDFQQGKKAPPDGKFLQGLVLNDKPNRDDNHDKQKELGLED